LCGEFATKRIWIEVVDESTLAVDLYDREPLAVARLQLRIPADVDFIELEVDLLSNLLENRARAFAEVATLRAIQDDSRDKYRA
jgi:hypothetical protein